MEDTLGRIWLPDDLPEKSADDRSAAAVAESQRLPRTSWTLDLDLTLESAKRDMVVKVMGSSDGLHFPIRSLHVLYIYINIYLSMFFSRRDASII